MSALFGVPSWTDSLGRVMVTDFGGRIAGWVEEHGGSELSGLSRQWFVLSGIGVGRENVIGVHRRWLVKCYLGALS